MSRLGDASAGSGYEGARDHMERLRGHIGAISGSLDGLAATVGQPHDQLDAITGHEISDGETSEKAPTTGNDAYRADRFDPDCSKLPEELRDPNDCLQEPKGKGYADKLEQGWLQEGRDTPARTIENLSQASQRSGTTSDMAVAEEDLAAWLRTLQQSDRSKYGNVYIHVVPPNEEMTIILTPFPNGFLNLKLPTGAIDDRDVMKTVNRFIDECPLPSDDWSSWKSPVVSATHPGRTWLRDWPSKAEEQEEILKASVPTDDLGHRNRSTGLQIKLVRAHLNEDLGAIYRWNLSIDSGFSEYGKNTISLVFPSAEQKYGCPETSMYSLFDDLIEFWQPDWATLRHANLISELEAQGIEPVTSTRIHGSSSLYTSWSEIRNHGIELGDFPREIIIEKRANGALLQAPGAFDNPETTYAVMLPEPRQMSKP